MSRGFPEEDEGKGAEEQISMFRKYSVRKMWLEWEGKLSEVEILKKIFVLILKFKLLNRNIYLNGYRIFLLLL